MADSAEETSGNITITVKTPKEKQDIEIGPDASIKELKEVIAKRFSAPIEQLCLIFAGKILKDGEALSTHGIKDGLTVHLVIKSANRSQMQAAQRAAEAASGSGSTVPNGAGIDEEGTTPSGQSTPNVSATPFGLGGLGGLAGIGNLGMGSANFMEMQQRMQREVMNNPEMLRQMMENPFVQQMMSNPDVMRQMIMSNPQMRELMERNPEITHMLNNPELMRQTLELARNPAMLQELMRSQDRAMSNLESIPGGFNALQRMYRDIQEPMMNAAQEGFGQNPFASLVGNNAAGTGIDGQQGRENTDPLPNPWAGGGSGSPSGTGTGTVTTTGTGSDKNSTSTTSTTDPAAAGPFGMFNTPGMQSLMGQMAANPQLIQNMMQAPYMQSMMQSLSANPELAQQILGSNPMFAGNPQLQEQFRQSLPTMMQQMQNPQVQSMMTNPRALNAIMQIQQGMQSLQSEAPNLFPSMPAMPGVSMPPAPGSSTQNTTSENNTAASPSNTAPSPSDTAASPTAPAATDSTATTTTGGGSGTTTDNAAPTAGDPFSSFMAQMVQMMAGGNLNAPPEERFASQLDQLATMGFVDREANIRALQATLGDVNAAIDRLLQQR